MAASGRAIIQHMMARIRNASLAGRQRTTVPATEITRKIAQALKEEGSIGDFQEVSDKTSRFLTITLKPKSKTNQYVILKQKRRPGLQVYTKKLPIILHGNDDEIITELRDENPTVRRKAVQALGEIISSEKH